MNEIYHFILISIRIAHYWAGQVLQVSISSIIVVLIQSNAAVTLEYKMFPRDY